MKITLITSFNPQVLSKQIARGPDGQLVKTSSAHLTHGHANTHEVANMSEFNALLDRLQPNQAMAYGVTRQGDVPLVSANKLAQHPGAVTRSDKHFAWTRGEGMMMLDYDPADGQQALSREQLLSTLFGAQPMLAAASWLWRPSASGNVYDSATGQELEGVKGQRVYVAVKEAADIPRAGDVLFKRLWLAGQGRIELAANGAMLVRGLIDSSVWQPSRLDFAAGAVCSYGLERRPPAGIWQDAGLLDTRAVLPDLTHEEERRYRELVEAAKRSRTDASEHVRSGYIANVAQAEGVSEEEVRARYDLAEQKGVLGNDFVVQLPYGKGSVSVKDIMLDPKTYHGMICLDPVEPEYNNYHPVGKIFHDEKGAYIDSKAHGGRVFKIGSMAALAFQREASSGTTFKDLMQDIRTNAHDLTEVPDLIDRVNNGPFSGAEVDLLRAELEASIKAEKKLTPEVKALIKGTQTTPQQDRTPNRGLTPQQGSVLQLDQALDPMCWHHGHTKGKDMKPMGTKQNFRVLLEAYGIGVRFNEMSKELSLQVPGVTTDSILQDEAALAEVESLANLNEFPKSDVGPMLVIQGRDASFSPVAEFIGQRPWDGINRFSQLFQQITLQPDEDVNFCYTLFRKWVLSAVSAGLGINNGCEPVLVFVDERGGTGKTRFFRSLCPVELRKDSFELDTADKDSIKEAISYWLIELGELDGTFSRSAASRLKAFLSAQFDEIRLPYGRKAMKYPRRTAYVGSVNSREFLVDSSDNRRFWPMRVQSLNFEHNIDMQQVWAQAQYEVMNGEQTHLTMDEMATLRANNETYRASSAVGDLLSDALSANDAEPQHITVTHLLKACGMYNPGRRELSEAGEWLRRAGFEKLKRSGVDGYMVPHPSAKNAAGAFSGNVTLFQQGASNGA